jgi:hypothetical protein
MLAYGLQILFAVKGSLSGTNERARRAFRNVTILMICAVIGFFVLAIILGLVFVFTSDSIELSMIPPWIQEPIGLFMVGSLLVSLVIEQPAFTNKNSQNSSNIPKGSEADLTQINSNLEKLRLDLENTSKSEIY